ncbi:MAG: ATP-binding protein [Steroidobacteraceae bacterium]|jgi:two-component system sensor histidine kinase PilS (NtrC family)|nr:ATP-binding protein [Steroidobacteraceae bacterium]
MSPRDIERVYGDPELAWRVLGLLNVYRLLVPTVLFVLASLLPAARGPGSAAPGLFTLTIVGMFLAGVLCIALLKRRWPDLRLQAYIHIAFDIFAVSLLLVSSGGVGSGLGLLLIMPVGAVSLLLALRSAVLVASIATLCILAQQFIFVLSGAAEAGSFTQAGLLGVVVFIVALAAAPLANRLRETEAKVRQRELDLANLAELSQYVVERLRESILVVDEQDRIRLINDSARQILDPAGSASGALLGEVSPRLLYLLATWRQNPRDNDSTRGTLLAADGMREVRPRFAPLGERLPSPVIVFLEDLSQISTRAEQSKLAALGRLSASIAHEIRNPVGAMSHAAQLLEEDEGLGPAERRLTEIIRQNAERVSTIIQNVMQLSRREEIRAERMPLGEWLADFMTEFCTTHSLRPERVVLRMAEPDLEVRIDPSHLHQILWNLCENAVKYGLGEAQTAMELNVGRAPGSGRPILEVADRGPGIGPAAAERIFEPFFTSSAGGTGLGLFISRELAQSNGALLLYEPRQGGGSIFRLIFADPQRWEPA